MRGRNGRRHRSTRGAQSRSFRGGAGGKPACDASASAGAQGVPEKGGLSLRVVYLDIDSLRPDHLGCYGYRRPTTPHIDRLAEQGVRFTRCYTSDSPCMPSRAALFSACFGIRNGIVTHGPRAQLLQAPGPSLPLLLRNAGLRTCTVSSFGRHPSPWFLVGWDEVADPTGWGFQGVPAWASAERAIAWLRRHATEDFFLHVHMWDPHGWRNAPDGCLQAVTADPGAVPPQWPTAEQVSAHQGMSAWHSARSAGMTDRAAVERMYDGYDAQVRYADHHVGLILKCLHDLGILDDTLVILSADHGQEFGEHGVYFEHWSVYEGTSRVPLIIRYPRAIAQGETDGGLAYQLDVTATVAEAFGLAIPAAWDSRSLWPRLHAPAAADGGRPYLVCGHGLYTAQRAVVQGRWKLIRTLNPGHWELPPVQLFDLTVDPWEQHDLGGERADVVQALSGLLNDWEYTHPSPGGVDPMRVNATLGPQGIMGPAARRMREATDGPSRTPRLATEERKPEVDFSAAAGWWA